MEYLLAVCADTAGNVFVPERSNRVRHVAAVDGIIETVVGNGDGFHGGDNGPATSASIEQPNGCSFDTNGELYVLSYSDTRVRRVSKGDNQISTVFGSYRSSEGDGGQATAATFTGSVSMFLDTVGGLYVAESSAFKVITVGDVVAMIVIFVFADCVLDPLIRCVTWI